MNVCALHTQAVRKYNSFCGSYTVELCVCCLLYQPHISSFERYHLHKAHNGQTDGGASIFFSTSLPHTLLCVIMRRTHFIVTCAILTHIKFIAICFVGTQTHTVNHTK